MIQEVRKNPDQTQTALQNPTKQGGMAEDCGFHGKRSRSWRWWQKTTDVLVKMSQYWSANEINPLDVLRHTAIIRESSNPPLRPSLRLPKQFIVFLLLPILMREMIKLHFQQNLINLPVVTLSDPPISNSLIDRIDSILSWPLISPSLLVFSPKSDRYHYVPRLLTEEPVDFHHTSKDLRQGQGWRGTHCE